MNDLFICVCINIFNTDHCYVRYNAGYIAFHPLLKDLEYYWKVTPGARYHCDINHDPFEKLKTDKKKLCKF